jgi:hypothetical protein
MAHRKPLGTRTGPMVFDWEGGNPQLGECLVSQAGTWYRVVGELEMRNPKKVKLVLERIAGPDQPGRVHEFEWYPRDKKRAA